MIDTNNLVNKIYQHTGRKLDPSDPAVAQLAAQQQLIKDFELDLSEVLDDLDARLTKIYSSQQQKISQLTDSKPRILSQTSIHTSQNSCQRKHKSTCQQ